MKTKLYKKYLKFITKKLAENNFTWGGNIKMLSSGVFCSSAEELDHIVAQTYLYSVAFSAWTNYEDWQSGMLSYAKDEIEAFKEKYKKYSRKYWTAEAQLRRAIDGDFS